jgi:uroporphyrinogen III methyltransferase/synthase
MKVYLIGAGPGDPELITVKAVRAIGACDTVVYDDLIPEEILLLAKPEAQKIYVGKRAGKDYMRQDEINQLLLTLARQGRTIARIKGGDPCVFGRGGEEALFLMQNGIPCEIIPGISSAIAGPESVGIPPTHRGLAASLKIVTAHEDPTKEDGFLDWPLLARESGTIVFLMGASRLGAIAERLVAEGMDAATPCAFIQDATLPTQRHVLTTLAQAGQAAASHNIVSPCVMVVGKVCDLSREILHAPDLPLKGRTILITRPSHLAFQTAALFASQGARTLVYPLIAIRDLPFELPDIGRYDIIIFTSQNAVPLFMDKVFSSGQDGRALAGKRIYCIGPKTRDALARYGIIPDAMAAEFRAEGIMDMLADKDLQGKRVCLPRAQGARPYLVQALHEKGAQVDEIPVYATVMPDGADAAGFSAMLAKVDTVIFTSPSGAKNAQALLADDLTLLQDKHLVAIGPVTAAAMAKLGMPAHLTAQEYTDDGIMKILQRSNA